MPSVGWSVEKCPGGGQGDKGGRQREEAYLLCVYCYCHDKRSHASQDSKIISYDYLFRFYHVLRALSKYHRTCKDKVSSPKAYHLSYRDERILSNSAYFLPSCLHCSFVQVRLMHFDLAEMDLATLFRCSNFNIHPHWLPALHHKKYFKLKRFCSIAVSRGFVNFTEWRTFQCGKVSRNIVTASWKGLYTHMCDY